LPVLSKKRNEPGKKPVVIVKVRLENFGEKKQKPRNPSGAFIIESRYREIVSLFRE